MFELDDFTLKRKIGVGAFGKVYLAALKRKSSLLFAIKILSKRKLLLKRQADQLESEIRALQTVNGHKFITKLLTIVNDAKSIGLVLEYVDGGELFYWLRRLKKFSEYASLFYTYEILIALEFIHKKCFLYRDLKPENILLTKAGHIKLTDFGFAMRDIEKSHVISGTPEYMSPEKLLNEDEGAESDFWSLGIILFEMLTGDPPFYDEDTNVIYNEVLGTDLQIPNYVSYAAGDLLARLLNKKRQERLGYWGLKDLKKHIFFKNVDWMNIENNRLLPPITPSFCKSSEYEYVSDEGDSTDIDESVPKKPYEYIKEYP